MKQSQPASPQIDKAIATGATLSSIINAVINGAIQWYLLAGHAPLPMTVEHQRGTHGVRRRGLSGSQSRHDPNGRRLHDRKATEAAILPLGVIVTFAVIWQRVFGSIFVSLTSAVVILGVIAGLVAAMVNYMTIRAATARP